MIENRIGTVLPDHVSHVLGFWASVAAASTFMGYTICFAAILNKSPVFEWTSLADYLAYDEIYGGPFRTAAQVLMIVFALSFVVLADAVQDCANQERKTLARIGADFGLLFALAVSIHYFAQVSAVRISVREGLTTGLEHFVQANPYSMLSALNMLGWGVFLGLTSLFLAPVFPGSGVERVIRWAFLANGIFCLGGGLGYILELEWLIFVTTTLGMGAAVLTATVALALWFRWDRASRDCNPLHPL
jgi:hypothetical protein